jgi:hypothetical protein
MSSLSLRSRNEERKTLSGFIGVFEFYFSSLWKIWKPFVSFFVLFVCLQIQDVEVELSDPNWTIFRAVQQLVQLADLGSRQEKLRRIWEPTYTLVSHVVLWNIGYMLVHWITDLLVVISQSRSYFTTDSQSVCRGVEPTLEPETRYYFLSEGCCLVSVGRPLWRDDLSQNVVIPLIVELKDMH